jgi:hypothetical protein
MFSCYLKLERRQTIKKDGSESKTPRYLVTAQAGYFKPLQSITNAKNEIVMYYQRNDKCNPNSTAETRIQCKGSVNFSSVYLENLKTGETLIGYGEPPQTKELKAGKGKKPNPFYDSRADGYLFIITPDLNTIEIIIVPGARYIIQGIAKQLSDGQLNEALEQMRNTAKPVF